MRLTRKLLVLVVLSTLAILLVRAWNGKAAERAPEVAKPVMSPEETRRLVEQALAQPRETVRFRFEPSPAEGKEEPPLPPPSLAAANPPPPPLAPTASSDPSLNAVRKLQEAFARLSKLPKPLAPTTPASPGAAAAAPASPTPAPGQ